MHQKIIKNSTRLGGSYFLLDTKDIPEKLFKELTEYVRKLEGITYKNYMKTVKKKWEHKKILKDKYSRLFLGYKNKRIYLILGMTRPKKLGKEEYIKWGSMYYTNSLKNDKQRRNKEISNLISRAKKYFGDKKIVAEIPPFFNKFQKFLEKYGGFKFCKNKKQVKKIIKLFKIRIKGEPEKVEVELFGKKTKQIIYKTRTIPHAMMISQ